MEFTVISNSFTKLELTFIRNYTTHAKFYKAWHGFDKTQ